MLLAYHADDEISSVALGVGIPLGLLVLALCGALWLRTPAGQTGTRAATWVLVAALLLAPLAFAGYLVYVALVSLPSLVLTAYAISVVRKAPSRVAIVALAVSALTSSYVISQVAACFVTNDCFH